MTTLNRDVGWIRWLRPMTLLVWVLGSSAAYCDWPSFRGPEGSGVAGSEADPPLEWGPGKNIAWQADLMGAGNGSPIVSDGRVYLAGSTDHGRRRGLYCYDLAEGNLLWAKTVALDAMELTHKSNPYCASTPATNGELVVVWHGTAGLHAYDRDGARKWSCDLGEVQHIWGYGSSPVIHGDRVILSSGAGDPVFIAAVSLRSGQVLWRVEEPGGTTNATPDAALTGSWATPRIVQDGSELLAICLLPTRVAAFSLATGTVRWFSRGIESERGKLVYASPIITEGRVVVMAGYRGPTFCVRLGGRGDVSKTHLAWRTADRVPQRIGSGVHVDGFVYIGNADAGTLECIDLETGRQRWKERVAGGPHWASMIYAGGRLYATNQSGMTRVFYPNPQRFELLAVNDLAVEVNASPAVDRGRLLIRGDKQLFCVQHIR